LFVTLTVHATVLAPPRPEASHWVILVTGSADVVVPGVVHTAGSAQVIVIVASPVGSLGVPGSYVKLLTTVIVQVTVLGPTMPTLSHSEMAMSWALAGLAASIVRPKATVKQKERRIPREKTRTFERGALLWVTVLLQSLGAGMQPGAAHAVQRSLQVATRHRLS
jgi:hypothetical protein